MNSHTKELTPEEKALVFNSNIRQELDKARAKLKEADLMLEQLGNNFPEIPSDELTPEQQNCSHHNSIKVALGDRYCPDCKLTYGRN